MVFILGTGYLYLRVLRLHMGSGMQWGYSSLNLGFVFMGIRVGQSCIYTRQNYSFKTATRAGYHFSHSLLPPGGSNSQAAVLKMLFIFIWWLNSESRAGEPHYARENKFDKWSRFMRVYELHSRVDLGDSTERSEWLVDTVFRTTFSMHWTILISRNRIFIRACNCQMCWRTQWGLSQFWTVSLKFWAQWISFFSSHNDDLREINMFSCF